MGLFEFQEKFATEEACRGYLVQQRWPEGFECPRCRNKEAGMHGTRDLYQCKKCRYQSSITTGTLFHKTRTPLRKWFWMIFIISQNKHGYSILGLQKLLGIKKYRTAWVMVQKIRKAMSDRDQRYKLSGLVEIDDSYFGGKNKEGKRGRGAAGKTPVVVAVEDRGDHARFADMQVVPDMSKESLQKHIQEKVQPEAVIKTDGWKSYSGLKKEGYNHETISMSTDEKALPWVHMLISNAKRFLIGTHHGVSKHHLQRYLSEYCYRFNRRFWQGQLFERLVKACVITTTITYEELRG